MTVKKINLERLSLEEFREASQPGANATVVGETERAALFWRATIDGSAKACVVLVSHPDYHLEPGVYQLSGRAALVAVQEQLYLLRSCRVARMVRLPCRFYEIIYSDEDRFIVQHEIGFTCLDYMLEVLWEWVGDLVSSWQIDAGKLAFATFEGEFHSLAIRPKS